MSLIRQLQGRCAIWSGDCDTSAQPVTASQTKKAAPDSNAAHNHSTALWPQPTFHSAHWPYLLHLLTSQRPFSGISLQPAALENTRLIQLRHSSGPPRRSDQCSVHTGGTIVRRIRRQHKISSWLPVSPPNLHRFPPHPHPSPPGWRCRTKAALSQHAEHMTDYS